MADSERQRSTFTITTANPDGAITALRRHLRSRGWARTHLVGRSQGPSVKTPGMIDVQVVIEGIGVRASILAYPAAGDTRWLPAGRILPLSVFDTRSFPNGTHVRALTEGESYARGRRTVMAAGAIGIVVDRDRTSLRVRFGEARPGSQTYGYAPLDLELVAD